MPTPQLKSFADEYGVPIDKVEEFWDTAKEQYGEDYEKVAGTVKKMCQNYSKSKNESLKYKTNFQRVLSCLKEEEEDLEAIKKEVEKLQSKLKQLKASKNDEDKDEMDRKSIDDDIKLVQDKINSLKSKLVD